MNAQNEERMAETFGMVAHEFGNPPIPAPDPSLMDMLNRRVGESSAALLKAWIGGWTKAAEMTEGE